jgi:glycosyltransferase involved in cell wall biosynthesis/2-polyprenyl-3-methyl-5-hydroxy-6-metoxy-1,4-benzoquinol methylase
MQTSSPETARKLTATKQHFLTRHTRNSAPEFLVSAFEHFLNRGIDEAGYNHWLTELYRGVSRSVVLDAFTGSEEFVRLCQGGFEPAKLDPPAPVAPLPARETLEQYQDIWVRGRCQQRGIRECADRYKLLHSFCSRFERPFTVLDIGSNLGYFSLRLAEDFNCTVVSCEGIYGDWIREIYEANRNPRTILLKKVFSVADLRALAQVEHFDVVMALSVIHHFDEPFDESLETLRSLGDHVLIELPNEDNACGQDIVRDAKTVELPPEAFLLGHGKSHLDGGTRPLYSLSRPKTTIEKSYLGTPRTDLALTISADDQSKTVSFHNKPENREWLPGINLQTFLWFNGVWPSPAHIARRIHEKGSRLEGHRDIQPWNVVMQGQDLQFIDADDPNHAFNYSDADYLDRLIRLLLASDDASRLGEQTTGVCHASDPLDVAEVLARHEIAMPVRWAGPIFNPSGYASEAINFLLPLADRLELGLLHHNNIYSEKFVAGLDAADRESLFRMRDRFDSVRGGITISHNPGNGLIRLDDADYCIGRTMFETDRIPADWVTNCNQMDEVWVPSQFNAETFAACGVERDKLVVMPGAVDTNCFDPDKHEPLPLQNRAGFNFLAIFEWSSRKAWDVLLAAYLREFSASDDVCLHLRTYQFGKPDGDPSEALWREIREFAATLDLGDKEWPRIELLTDQVASQDLPRLYKAADCLVGTSRGEGWGRPQHEAMSMGLPVIATNWSGNTEFMTPDTARLIDFELEEAVGLEPELWHYRKHRWANPSETQLREAMRQLKSDPAEANALGQRARAHIVRNFSREAVADKVIARLAAIERRLQTPDLAPIPTIPPRAAAAASSKSADALNLSWEGSFLDFGSLSHVNRELTRALSKHSDIKLNRIGKNALPPNADAQMRDIARRLKAHPKNNTQVTVRHNWPPDWSAPAGELRIHCQPWEYGILPSDWVEQIQNVDEVWAYTHHVRRAYIDSGIEPEKVKVVPLGFDPDRFHPHAEPLELATRKTFKFLFVGGTIHRKGIDLLLRAYLESFDIEDDVCLVIKDFGSGNVYRGQTAEEQIRAAQTQTNAPEILYLDAEMSGDEIPGLYTACDCLVHPYRGEGFGLPVLEAMACGLPAIVTGGGATDDFAGDDHAWRIPSRRVRLGSRVGEIALNGKGWLLEPCANTLKQKICEVYSQPEEARTKGRAASEYAHRDWTWERAAETAALRIREAWKTKQAAAEERRRQRGRSANIQLPTVARLGYLGDAQTQLDSGNTLQAWSNTLEAMAQRPFHPEGWLTLARIAREAGDVSTAKRCAGAAELLAPGLHPARKFSKSLRKQKGSKKIDWPAIPDVLLPGSHPRLSVILIARNEEQFLGQCLTSVSDIADQIVVVDTGSTDNTIAIAREHGAEVHEFKWNDDFSAARNESLLHARGDWVLFIDADEELLAEGKAGLREAMSQADTLAWRLPIVDVDREHLGHSYVPRLFRNAPGLFFVGRIHEQVSSSVEARRADWGLENRIGTATLRHHGYQEEVIRDRRKTARNISLLERAVEEFPNDANLLMNLGLELARAGQLGAALDQYADAFTAFCHQPAAARTPELREALLTQFATQLLAVERFREVVTIFDSPVARAAALTASHEFLFGLALMNLKRHRDAAKHFRVCLDKRSEPTLTPANEHVVKGGPDHCLALCLGHLQDTEAANYFERALEQDGASIPLRVDYARYLAKAGNSVRAIELLHPVIGNERRHLPVWHAGAEIANNQAELLGFATD